MSYTPIGVGLAVVVLLLLAGLINHQERAEGADGRAAQHAQSTPQCVTREGLAPVGGIQAPPPEPNPKREEWRSERDLEAQQEMARWALLMMIASFLSVGVTAVGVVFVKQTLDATRAAVNEAENATAAARNTINVTQDLGRRQLRAYIDIKNGAFRVGPAGKGRLRVRVEFANFGQTPARDVRFWVRINWFKPGEFTFTEPDNRGWNGALSAPAISPSGTTVSTLMTTTSPRRPSTPGLWLQLLGGGSHTATSLTTGTIISSSRRRTAPTRRSPKERRLASTLGACFQPGRATRALNRRSAHALRAITRVTRYGTPLTSDRRAHPWCICSIRPRLSTATWQGFARMHWTSLRCGALLSVLPGLCVDDCRVSAPTPLA